MPLVLFFCVMLPHNVDQFKTQLLPCDKFLCKSIFCINFLNLCFGRGTSANPTHAVIYQILNPTIIVSFLIFFMHAKIMCRCVSNTHLSAIQKSPYVWYPAFLPSNVFLVEHLGVARTPLTHAAARKVLLFCIVCIGHLF